VVAGLGAESVADGFTSGYGVAERKTAIRLTRCRHDDKRRVGSEDCGFGVLGGGKTPIAFVKEFGEARFMNGRELAIDSGDFFRIDIDGVNAKTTSSEAGGDGRTKFPKADDRN
jgi:hypothetical protein